MAWAAIGAAAAAALTRLSAGEALRLLGLSDPGALTTVGLPAVQGAAEVAAVVTVGSLLLAAALVPPQPSGVLDVDGYLAMRTAGISAAVWACCAALLVPLTLSDTSGRPLGEMAADPLPFAGAIRDIDVTEAWAWTAGSALLVAFGCVVALRHRWTPVLLGLAVLTLLPRAVSGHSAAGGSHDIATNSLVLHVVAAALWAGGLAALVLHVRRGGRHLDLAVRRFSRIATVAFVVVAASGVVNATVRVPLRDLTAGTYGILVLSKLAALILGGLLGWRQRRIATRTLDGDPADRGSFARLAATEALLLAVTIGMAVALGRTPPPAPEQRREPTALEEKLGYLLDGPPTTARLLLDWRFDLLFGTAALVLAVGYLVGVRRLTRAGRRWPRRRVAAWLCGCALLLLATSSGVGRYAPAVFSVHLSALAVIGLAVPLCWAAGAPLTLLRATLGSALPGTAPGIREWLGTLSVGAPVRALTNPVVAWLLFTGGFAWLHLGGLYGSVAGSHVWHVLTTAYALTSGCLLFWVGLGADPMGRPRLSRSASLGFLGSALAAYIAIAVVLRDGTVVAAQYYLALHRGWLPDLAADQRLGTTVAIGVGLLVLAAALTAASARGAGPAPRPRSPVWNVPPGTRLTPESVLAKPDEGIFSTSETLDTARSPMLWRKAH